MQNTIRVRLVKAALFVAGAFIYCALSAYAGTTYYKIGRDEANCTSFGGSYIKYDGTETTIPSTATTIGWATSRNAASAVVVDDMGNSDFVVQSGTRLRTHPAGGNYAFGGRSLALEAGGELMVKSGDVDPRASTITVAKLVGSGGSVLFNVYLRMLTLAGAAEIEAGSSLTVALWGDGQKAAVSSEITGDATTTLYIKTADTAGAAGQVLEIADAAGFYGTIATNSYSTEPFTLKLTGGFGGTVASLPAGTTNVLVNYDGLPAAKGLRVAATTIPAALKTAVWLYSAGGISEDTVLMTFPAGTTVDEGEFKVRFSVSQSAPATEFRCRKVLNGDGSVSLLPATCHKRGQDAAYATSFFGYYASVDEEGVWTEPETTAIGWSLLRDGSTTKIPDGDLADFEFVVQSGTRLRTPAPGGTWTFRGRSLVLESGGSFITKSGDGREPRVDSVINVTNLVGSGGSVQFNVAGRLQTLAGTASIASGSSLTLDLPPPNQKAVFSSTLTGDGTTTLYIMTAQEAGTDGQSLEIADAAGFYGTIATNNYSTEPFTLKLTGGFGGTVASLPAGTTNVLVNYDGLPAAAGLRVAATTIPPALKTAATFYFAADIPEGSVLMTFPEGTAVDPDEFDIRRAAGPEGAGRRITALGTKTNGDGTVSLVKLCGFIFIFR